MRQTLGSFARAAIAVSVLACTVWAQVPGRGPIDQRIGGRRIAVPPIAERISIAPLTEGSGAFSATPPSTVSRIYGVVLNEAGLVVPTAGTIIVRSLHDARVIGTTQVDSVGNFALQGVAPGLYSADLVNPEGAVLTSSPAFTVGVGQIVQLTPVIPQNSLGGLASLIGSGTAGAVNSAVSAGVLAIETPAEISPVRTGG